MLALRGVQPFTNQVTKQQIDHIARDPLLLAGWLKWLKSSYMHETPLCKSAFEEILVAQGDRTRRLVQVSLGGNRKIERKSGSLIGPIASLSDLERLGSQVVPPTLPLRGRQTRHDSEVALLKRYKKDEKNPRVQATRFLFAELLVVLLRLVVASWVSSLPGAGVYGVNCAKMHEQFSFLHAWNASLFGLYLVRPVNSDHACTRPFETLDIDHGVPHKSSTSNRYVVSPPISILADCHEMLLAEATEDFSLSLTFPLVRVQEFFLTRGFPPLESVNEFLLLYPHWHQRYYSTGSEGSMLECAVGEQAPHSVESKLDENRKSSKKRREQTSSLHCESQEVRRCVLKQSSQNHTESKAKAKKSKVWEPSQSAAELSQLPAQYQELLLLSSVGKDVRFQLHGNIHVVAEEARPNKFRPSESNKEPPEKVRLPNRLLVVVAPTFDVLQEVHAEFRQEVRVSAPDPENRLSPIDQRDLIETLLASRGYCHRGLNRNLFHRYFPGVQSPWMAAESPAFAPTVPSNTALDWRKKNGRTEEETCAASNNSCGTPLQNKTSRAAKLEKLNFGASLETQRRRRWLLHLLEEMKRQHNASWGSHRTMKFPSNKQLVKIFEERYSCKTIPMAVAMDVKSLQLNRVNFGESAESTAPMIHSGHDLEAEVTMDGKDPLARCRIIKNIFHDLTRDFDGEAPTATMLYGVVKARFPKLRRSQLDRDLKIMALEPSPSTERINRSIIRDMARQGSLEHDSTDSGKEDLNCAPWMLNQVPETPGEAAAQGSQPVVDCSTPSPLAPTPQKPFESSGEVDEDDDGFLAADSKEEGNDEEGDDEFSTVKEEDEERRMQDVFGDIHPELLDLDYRAPKVDDGMIE